MKIITTLITSLVLSLGLVVAPASATSTDPVPGGEPSSLTCEWTELAVLKDHVYVLEQNVIQANEFAYEMVQRANELETLANQRQAKITELRAIIRQLRRR
jgi:hypothetical protein